MRAPVVHPHREQSGVSTVGPTGRGGPAVLIMVIVLIGLVAVLAGCSGAPEPTATESRSVATSAPASVAPSPGPSGATSAPVTASPSTATPDARGAGLVLEVSVRGRSVSPQPGRHSLHTGERVRLVLTVDKANVVHVHGADVERPVPAGVPLTVDFTVDQPGVFPVELHDPELLLLQLVVR
jgi:hypothetical protein